MKYSNNKHLFRLTAASCNPLFVSIIVVNLIVNDRLNSYGEAAGNLFL